MSPDERLDAFGNPLAVALSDNYDSVGSEVFKAASSAADSATDERDGTYFRAASEQEGWQELSAWNERELANENSWGESTQSEELISPLEPSAGLANTESLAAPL